MLQYNFKRYKRRNKRISFVVKAKKARNFLDFFVGKIRDQGSNFSHETRIREAAGVLAIQEKFFYSVAYYRIVTSSNATKAVWIRSIACLTSSSCKVASLFKKRIE